ncbi:hypothetical protein HELRODRAFT_130073, partial [Helobdella robusta]|uniref:G-protein coupled receptors family 1 profile domain-containing protein n=1 Tax=Helobdella robusta TaxID=6412 RepID=T1EHT0_HELRO
NNNNENYHNDYYVTSDDVTNQSMLKIYTAFYALVFVIGTIGNISVVYALTAYPQLKSVTNTYILNLAVSDIFYLFGIPFLLDVAVKSEWVHAEFFCKTYLGLSTINWFSSVFTLTTLSIDRYLAVCKAIHSATIRTQLSARCICLVVWILSAFFSSPVFIFSRLVENDDGRWSCILDLPEISGDVEYTGLLFIWGVFIIAYIIPIICISIFYSLVLHRVRRLGPKNVVRVRTGRKDKRRVTIVVSMLIAMYLICWTPYWLFQIIVKYLEGINEWVRVLYQFLSALTYLNSAANPILYSFLNDNFRNVLKNSCC